MKRLLVGCISLGLLVASVAPGAPAKGQNSPKPKQPATRPVAAPATKPARVPQLVETADENGNIAVGAEGMIDYIACQEIISDTEAVCRFYTSYWGPGREAKTAKHLVLLRGFDFSKSADGKRFDVNALVRVEKPERVEQAGGRVFVIVPVNASAPTTKPAAKPKRPIFGE